MILVKSLARPAVPLEPGLQRAGQPSPRWHASNGSGRHIRCSQAEVRLHRRLREEMVMSKGMDSKKGSKKPATKTLKEKRAAKKLKKS